VADTFQLRLLTPERSLFEGPVEAVIVPGENGQLGVLAGHTKLVTTLVPGVVRYVASGQTHQVAASGGFAEVSPGGVTILADTAEPPQEIDRLWPSGPNSTRKRSHAWKHAWPGPSIASR